MNKPYRVLVVTSPLTETGIVVSLLKLLKLKADEVEGFDGSVEAAFRAAQLSKKTGRPPHVRRSQLQ